MIDKLIVILIFVVIALFMMRDSAKLPELEKILGIKINKDKKIH